MHYSSRFQLDYNNFGINANCNGCIALPCIDPASSHLSYFLSFQETGYSLLFVAEDYFQILNAQRCTKLNLLNANTGYRVVGCFGNLHLPLSLWWQRYQNDEKCYSVLSLRQTLIEQRFYVLAIF